MRVGMGNVSETRRPKPFLFPEFCKGCGRCITACQRHSIAFSDHIDPRTGLVPVEIDLDTCNGCGLCFDACPEPYGLLPRPGRRLRLRARGSGAAVRTAAPRRADAGRSSRSPRGAAAVRAAGRQRQLRGRHRRAARRLPPLLRLSDHAVHRGRRADGGAAAEAAGRVSPGGQRSGDGQSHVRHRQRGAAVDDVHVVARLQPDARGHLVHDRRRSARRVRQHHARRARPRQHRARSRPTSSSRAAGSATATRTRSSSRRRRRRKCST